ncbi:MAG TPA: CHRD domain-containing protein [Thermoanaerobaculia bacterium]|nr:CHRD domain-containing protein [Thermoanaerobaculia bacterium]
MRRFGVAILLTLICSGAVAQTTLNAVLTGGQEAPNPVTTPGSGFATVVVDPTRTSVTVTVTFSKLTSNVTLAHIHRGGFGVAGPPVVDLLVPPSNLSGNRISGTYVISPSLGDELVATPQNFYVNVHTTQFPGGEIRGQLGTASNVLRFAGELRGSNEAPTPNNSLAVGAFHIELDAQNNLTYEVNVDGLVNPTAAHIHTGAAGSAGGILVNLATSASQIQNGRITGTVSLSSLTAQQLALFYVNAQNNLYVNVHTTAFPGGEIRGQLMPANEYYIGAAGHVTNGLGQTFITDVRIFNPSYETNAAVLVEYFPLGNSALTPVGSVALQVKPRGTAVLDDIVAAQLRSSSPLGALRVSSHMQLAVTSRTFADLRGEGKGTFGQFLAGIRRSALLTRGTLPQLSSRTDTISTGFRTNLGFFNPNASSAIVRLELRDDSGTLIGSNTVTLPAMNSQLSAIGTFFPTVDVSTRPALTVTFESSLPIVAFGSVVDNVSGDQIAVVAQEDTALPATLQ